MFFLASSGDGVVGSEVEWGWGGEVVSFCVCVCVFLWSQSTTRVMSRWSVNLFTLLLGRLRPKQLSST